MINRYFLIVLESSCQGIPDNSINEYAISAYCYYKIDYIISGVFLL